MMDIKLRSLNSILILLLLATGSVGAEVSSWALLSSRAELFVERSESNSVEVIRLRDAVIKEFHIENIEGIWGPDESKFRYVARITFQSEQWAKLTKEYSQFVCWTKPQAYSKNLIPNLGALETLLKTNPVPIIISISASNLQATRALYNTPNSPLAPECTLGLFATIESYFETLPDGTGTRDSYQK